ncbi:ATP-binding protein [Sphaerisporangium sp. TRM90804]|uniref:ATP-binding protein n=1 Tax=Sphaerisporangium sp. TRM90804 TaxID=3031113 RepID=UPI002447720D|nr:ATP-binding protein [Sphaerisporangium sp. TRM90804]MDH2428920.1 ATP-binding protein [Sphaerisporangium sp. TRM90804]
MTLVRLTARTLARRGLRLIPRVLPEDREHTASWPLLPEPTTVPEIRERVRGRLADWGACDQGDVVELLVSELVTNAMRHAWGGTLTLTLEQGTLRCEVVDTNPAMPQVCQPDEADEGGRGMCMVQALADSWGCYPVPSGKVVWFQLHCSAACAAGHRTEGRTTAEEQAPDPARAGAPGADDHPGTDTAA